MTRILYTLFLGGVGALVAGCGGGGAPANQPPALSPATFSAAEDGEVSGTLAATDPENDPVTFSRASDPSSGTVSSFTPDGAFVYRPNPDFAGTDSFSVTVTDSAGNSASGSVTLTITPVDDPPVAVNDVQRVDGPALAAINLLANDREPDGDALNVTIEEPALVGTASVNADGTVSIAGLPAGFRGVTRFRYRIADPGGASSVATAAIFVGTDPFRAVFAGDVAGDGSTEVYMTDFVSPPWRLSAATEGSMRLRGFAVSENGATVVYRRQQTASAVSDLAFVRSTAPEQPVRITLPDGAVPVPDENGRDQLVVSPDGRWIAIVGQLPSGERQSLYVLNVEGPGSVRSVAPASTVRVTLPRFSADSTQLYFLTSDRADGLRRLLYRVAPAEGAAAVLMSAPYATDDVGDIEQYSVSSDQSRVVLHAVRGGVEGIYYVDPSTPGNETQISHALDPSQSIFSSTVGLPAGLGSTPALERVAYTVVTTLGAISIPSVHMVQVGSSPDPRQVTDFAEAVAWRADGLALLVSRFSLTDPRSSELAEVVPDAGTPPERVAGALSGFYDSTGDTIVVRQADGTLAVAERGAFGNVKPLGSPGQVPHAVDFSGIGHGVVVIGEGPPGAAPASARLALVNARAPDRPLYLQDTAAPLGLTSDVARIVSY